MSWILKLNISKGNMAIRIILTGIIKKSRIWFGTQMGNKKTKLPEVELAGN